MSQKHTAPLGLTNFDDLPDAANVRLPTVKLLYGISAATVWRLSGKSIPAPRKISARVTAWNVGELRAALSMKEAAND
jgi:predicted DNA-binding transcriptional regulator AlpA